MPRPPLSSPTLPQTTKLVKELQAKRKVCGHDPTHVQRDIQLRELRDFGSNVVQRLGSLSTKNPDLVPTLQLMFSQAGLPPAPSPSSSSRASSQFSSARSSVVSSRYGACTGSRVQRAELQEADPVAMSLGFNHAVEIGCPLHSVRPKVMGVTQISLLHYYNEYPSITIVTAILNE